MTLITARASRLRALLGVLLTFVFGLAMLATAGPAQAHATLDGTTPKVGQTLTTAPTFIRLSFLGNVISLGTLIQVIGPAGVVNQGKPVVNRSTVTQSLAPSLANGSYLVNWRVVSDDGHPSTGTFSFGIAVPGGAAAPTATPGFASGASSSGTTAPSSGASPAPVATFPSPSPFPTSTTDDTNGSLPPFWVGVGLVIVIVIVAVAYIVDRRRRTSGT